MIELLYYIPMTEKFGNPPHKSFRKILALLEIKSKNSENNIEVLYDTLPLTIKKDFGLPSVYGATMYIEWRRGDNEMIMIANSNVKNDNDCRVKYFNLENFTQTYFTN